MESWLESDNCNDNWKVRFGWVRGENSIKIAILVSSLLVLAVEPGYAQTTTTTTTTTSSDGATTTEETTSTTTTSPPTVVVVPAAPVYGPAGVVGTARRVGRRTARRTSHRVSHR